MTFADQVLIRLAVPATRASVFDDIALKQIAAAAYDTSRATLDGPYSAVFDELQLGLPVPRIGTAEGHWGLLGGSDRSGATFNVSGLGPSPLIVDAFWRGCIVARVTVSTGHVEEVESDWPDVSAIDRDIVATLGALPADPVAREQARRSRLMARMKAHVSDADVVTSAVVDRLVAATRASSLNEFFDRYARTAAFGPVTVTYSTEPAAAPVPKPLPVAAAILIRETTEGLAQLLADSRTARAHLEGAGHGRSEGPGLPIRQGVLVVWVLPAAAFDNPQWPGTTPAARRVAAGDWLSGEGIGLAVTG